ncbi:MAG: 16S rRNA (uracil(1498)-N(3))-methyltransferase [Phenylobacterium sp.]|nr:16S rRNA (uracil(1498)-N(3))-methyltransferase [Phenylobacterium sp.]
MSGDDQGDTLHAGRREAAVQVGVRLFVDADLAAGVEIALDPAQAHYLRNVMRRAPGDAVRVFNGRDGEWRAVIRALGKGKGSIAAEDCLRPQAAESDLWLLAAPIKRTAIDFVAAKATELGASAILPIFTRRTAVSRVNIERLRANAIEAAEQCERLSVPAIREAAPLEKALAGWPPARRLLFCDESRAGQPIAAALLAEKARDAAAGTRPWAILIGPEGGFAPEELARLRALPAVLPVSLGARLLRADTAALMALAVWQAVIGG